jgi:hypothetical protein
VDVLGAFDAHLVDHDLALGGDHDGRHGQGEEGEEVAAHGKPGA